MRDIVSAIGRGKRLARDLSGEEAAAAMTLIMEGKASPYQVGAFLIAMRVKGETAEEIVAFTRVARRYGNRLKIGKVDFLVDIPVYAGKKSGFYAAPCYALVMAASGVPVVLHGSRGFGGKTSAEAVIQAAGLTGRLSPDSAARVLESTGFAYVDISELNPVLHRLLGLRRELGVRTVVNTILRLYDPVGAGRHMIGITHRAYFEHLAKAMGLLGGSHALLFRGAEGESELALPPRLALTEVRQGVVEELSYELRELGLGSAAKMDLAASGCAEQAELMLGVLCGRLNGPCQDAVLLNAGCGIYISGMVASVAEGIAAAREALCSGAAARKLRRVTEMWEEVS